MKNTLGKILRFGRMQQNIFFFENALNFFFEIFQKKTGILILDLCFTVQIYNPILCKIGRKIFEKITIFLKGFFNFFLIF